MERLRVEDALQTDGFCQSALGSGVRVSAAVSSEGSGPNGGERPDIFVRAIRGDRRLEFERHAGYERAAARFVELVDEYADASDEGRGPQAETGAARSGCAR
jgi:hypothetical protein